MPLFPVRLPPGFYMNGTSYAGKNRWIGGNRVRWHDGSLRPIGGWERRARRSDGSQIAPLVADPATETVRDMFSWRLNNGDRATVFGSNTALYYMNSNNDIIDVTPVEFTPQANMPIIVVGYGTGPYGTQAYSTPRNPASVDPIPVYRWEFDVWGEDLLASPLGVNGNLYAVDLTGGVLQSKIIVPNAPTEVRGFVVTQQRIVMTIGDPNEPRKVQWSAREDREEWTPALDNEAGNYTLAGVGDLLSIDKVLNQVLILSETDAYVARYVGAPYIYGFDLVGKHCAPLHPAAVITSKRFAMWMGRRNFWMYDGTVKHVPCEVMNFLQKDVDFEQISRVVGYTNEAFTEVTWHYTSVVGSGNEVDSYVTYDYVQKHWTTGKIDRTASADKGSLRDVVMVDPTGVIWNHEQRGITTPDANAYTGPLELGLGDKNMAVRYIFPDTATKGDVEYTLFGKQMPTEPEYSYGPYPYNNPTPVRALGREIRMQVSGEVRDWEVGPTHRFDVAPITGMR